MLKIVDLLTYNILYNNMLMNIHVIINIHLHSDDFNRVVLSEIPDVEHSHYINASYVDVSTYW